jgi:flotillin
MNATLILIASSIGVITLIFLIAASLRRVVPTDLVHVVQGSKKTTAYGKDSTSGNVYYEFPAWLPRFGVVVRKLPISNFTISLDDYEAYDKGKVPFNVTIKAFFRIDNAEEAAARVENFEELEQQLNDILRGAIRSILAETEIEKIMEERNTFGEKFSTEVDAHLQQWGVKSVKNIELMDVSDAEGTRVITNIQDKNRTAIEKVSRIAVATNEKEAKIQEIQAKQEADVKEWEAKQLVGERQATAEQKVGVAQQVAVQNIKEEEAITKTKEMQVVKVGVVRAAEIEKEKVIIEANQLAQRVTIEATGEKKRLETLAEADKNAENFRADGLYAVGKKEADVVKETELAKISGKVVLADKISSLPGYMEYLTIIKNADVAEAVGKKQADALKGADLKLISTGGASSGGDDINGLLGMLSAGGGAKLGAMLDSFRSTSKREEPEAEKATPLKKDQNNVL